MNLFRKALLFLSLTAMAHGQVVNLSKTTADNNLTPGSDSVQGGFNVTAQTPINVNSGGALTVKSGGAFTAASGSTTTITGNLVMPGTFTTPSDFILTSGSNGNIKLDPNGNGGIQLNGPTTTIPGYIFCGFTNSDDGHMYMLSSTDLTNFNLFTGNPMVFTPPSGSSRDMTLLQIQNQILIAFTTSGFGTGTTFGFASTKDLVHVSYLQSVSCSGVSGANQVWMGKWFVDSDGSIHLTLAISTDSGSTHQMYEIHPTNPTAVPSSWTWSTPVAITGTNLTGVGIYNQISITKVGSLYNGVLSNNNTHRLEVATSSSLTSGWTVYAPGIGNDYLGLGQAEGGAIIPTNTTNQYYLYYDNIGNEQYVLITLNASTGLIGYTNITSATGWANNIPGSTSLRNGSLLALSGNYLNGSGFLADYVSPEIANLLYNNAQVNVLNTFTKIQSFNGSFNSTGAASINGGIAIGPANAPSSGMLIGGSSGNSKNNFVEIGQDGTGSFAGDNGVGQLIIRGLTNPSLTLGFLMDTTNSIAKIQSELKGTGGLTLELNPSGGRTLLSTGTDDGVTPVQSGSILITGKGNILSNVSDAAPGTCPLTIKNTNTGGYSGFEFDDSSSGQVGKFGYFNSASTPASAFACVSYGHPIEFIGCDISNTERARFAITTGDLLLNTTTDDTTSKLQVNGNETLSGILYGTGSTPSHVDGTNSTATVTGTNIDGTLQVVVATGATSGIITTLTLANSKTFPTKAVIQLTPGNAATANLLVADDPFVTGTANTCVLTSGGTGMPVGTYLWNYHIGGY